MYGAVTLPHESMSPTAAGLSRQTSRKRGNVDAQASRVSSKANNWSQVTLLEILNSSKNCCSNIKMSSIPACLVTGSAVLSQETQCFGHCYCQVLVLCWTHCVIGWGFFIFQFWMPTYLHSLGAADLGSMSFLSALPWSVSCCAMTSLSHSS